MKITKTNIENLAESKVMIYKLTKAPSLSLQKMNEEQLSKAYPVDAFLYYEDTNAKGETVNVLAILSGDVVLSTVGKTFIDSFFEIAELMGNDPFAIRVYVGESKSKRRFFDCVLDC